MPTLLPDFSADLTPDFAKGGGLVAAVAQDAASGEVLMLAWMDRAAWDATLKTGEAHYFSRSRQRLWHKGETSGHVQKVRAIRLDCDADAVLLEVEQMGGAACHEGYRSCFFRRLSVLEEARGNAPESTRAGSAEGIREGAPPTAGEGRVSICCPRVFDPASVYPS
ncbi:MAG: phosphoribosyl-AMP cyclohydrolase [Desulfovibrionaceae bacterium]|nr:phosphoribosyl-AMP cyclohydrolase [Desulfovibrionaceae bacterium]